ncbi:MAG: polysaccharide biosynthesis tyrosine autokinase [Flavisolibacter sp.]|nr:polysaccharide biosynthesis tyrosine autokinase [Flavisolibacter sp.]
MEEQFQLTAPRNEANEVNIKELFSKYIRFLPLFILSVALALLVAYMYLRYATPIYQSNCALLIKRDNTGGSSDPFQQMFVLDNSMNIQNEIEILQSRPVMDRVVEDLNLNFSYYSIGKIGETNLYNTAPFKIEVMEMTDSNAAFTLDIHIADEHGFRINEEKNIISFGQAFKTGYGTFRLIRNAFYPTIDEYRISWLPTKAVASQLVSKLTVVPKGTTGTLLISLEATHPVLAANVLNTLMQEYQVVTREDKNETNRRMLDFIDLRLKSVQKELDSVTGVLLAYQNANDMINPEAQSAAFFNRMETTTEALIGHQVQDNIARMIDSYLRDPKNPFNPVPSNLGLADATLNTMIAAYNVAQLERKSLLDANVPVTNVRVQQKEAEIERLRVNILESLRNLRSSIALSVSRLQRTSDSVRGQMRRLPAKEQNLLEIKMQKELKQGVYNLLMNKREQTAISLAGTISNMKVIEEATLNFTPVKPNPRNVRLIAIAIGLVLPALFIFIIEVLNDKVNTRSDIEKVTAAPVIGEIGHSYAKESLVVRTNQRSVVAEQFRIVRSNLQYVLTHIEKPVILVTSSFSGEGKSFISTNLGAVMSLANKRTIVLEFDIRKPKILSHLGIPKKPGITNYLLGKVKVEDLPIPVPGYDNLFVLACGPVPPNPGELLLDTKLNELFQYLRQHFDVVVIDTAPVGMVSDAMTLSRFASSTLYIVRQGHTYKKQIILIDEFHSQGKLPKVSVILNDVKVQGRYGYYGKGNYAYAYGSGYFDDEETTPTIMNTWFGWLDIKKWNKKKRKKRKLKV